MGVAWPYVPAHGRWALLALPPLFHRTVYGPRGRQGRRGPEACRAPLLAPSFMHTWLCPGDRHTVTSSLQRPRQRRREHNEIGWTVQRQNTSV